MELNHWLIGGLGLFVNAVFVYFFTALPSSMQKYFRHEDRQSYALSFGLLAIVALLISILQMLSGELNEPNFLLWGSPYRFISILLIGFALFLYSCWIWIFDGAGVHIRWHGFKGEGMSLVIFRIAYSVFIIALIVILLYNAYGAQQVA